MPSTVEEGFYSSQDIMTALDLCLEFNSVIEEGETEEQARARLSKCLRIAVVRLKQRPYRALDHEPMMRALNKLRNAPDIIEKTVEIIDLYNQEVAMMHELSQATQQSATA